LALYRRWALVPSTICRLIIEASKPRARVLRSCSAPPNGIERFPAAAGVPDRKPHTVWRENGAMLAVDED
jgi:hypothetical protein